MNASHDEIVRGFLDHGFRISYRSTAITLLAHPEHPGLAVRVGTVWVVAERDGRVFYHVHRDAFDIGEALARIARR